MQTNLLDEARRLYESEKYKEALAKYYLLAEQGNPECQVMLGWMYQNGEGTSPNNEEAIRWYKSAANANLPEAKFYLGKLYSIRKDFSEALRWYKAASLQDYAPAIYKLGVIYRAGRGVEPDVARANKFFAEAAAKGHLFGKKEIARQFLKESPNIFGRAKGVYLLTKILLTAVWIGLRDPHSDKIRT